MTAPIDLATRPWWRWTRGLHSAHGLVVRIDADGVPVVRLLEDDRVLEIRWDERVVRRSGVLLPDIADELLPGHLLHLLEEVHGEACWVDTAAAGGMWCVRCKSRQRPIAMGRTRMLALTTALDATTAGPS